MSDSANKKSPGKSKKETKSGKPKANMVAREEGPSSHSNNKASHVQSKKNKPMSWRKKKRSKNYSKAKNVSMEERNTLKEVNDVLSEMIESILAENSDKNPNANTSVEEAVDTQKNDNPDTFMLTFSHKRPRMYYYFKLYYKLIEHDSVQCIGCDGGTEEVCLMALTAAKKGDAEIIKFETGMQHRGRATFPSVEFLLRKTPQLVATYEKLQKAMQY